MSSSVATVVAAQTGDAEAFTQLVRAWATTVCAIGTAITRDPVRGEEVAQDVFVHAWTGLGQLRNPRSFPAWIRQLARNRARDAVRREARRREVGASPLETEVHPHDPARELLAREEEEAVWAALEELSDDDREVLVLFYREGRSVEQVAGLLELRPVAVRKRLSRARERLRGDVGERLGDVLTRSTPTAAFVAGVAALLVGASPGVAHAAGTAGAAKLGLGAGLGAGAALGAAGGLAGVWVGHRQALSATPQELRPRLRRHSAAQGIAVVVAALLMAGVSGPVGVLVGMTLLGAVLGGTALAWPLHRARMLGTSAGLAAGLLGAAGGLAMSGALSFPVALAVLVQLQCFVAVPLALGFAGSWHLGQRWRWWFVGALGWLVAAPVLGAGTALAVALFGQAPLVGAVGLSVSAGFGEESVRLLLLGALWRWVGPVEARRAVVLGLGHGGVEAVLFGLGTLATVAGGATAGAADHALYGLSRLFLLLCHVGFTLMVWRALRDRSPVWWVTAVAVHVAIDLAAFAGPLVWPSGGGWLGGVSVLAVVLVSAGLLRSALGSGGDVDGVVTPREDGGRRTG
ncbi:MAG: sigma-70 family RNA polymerase sigma factor [Alphaproteobacteria bacterium]|nr:sigma-70 family RNA polymerase sigma factor [Alphaproteobacteria bacterium]